MEGLLRELEELGNKASAKILLADSSRRIRIPTYDEWIGIGLLERDDELIRKSNRKVNGSN